MDADSVLRVAATATPAEIAQLRALTAAVGRIGRCLLAPTPIPVPLLLWEYAHYIAVVLRGGQTSNGRIEVHVDVYETMEPIATEKLVWMLQRLPGVERVHPPHLLTEKKQVSECQ